MTLEPGHFNVFIGANGCGKSNVLEALALLAGAMTGRTTPEDLFNRGYRVARPDSTRSSFRGEDAVEAISLEAVHSGNSTSGEPTSYELVPSAADSIAARWFDREMRELRLASKEEFSRDLIRLERLLDSPEELKQLERQLREAEKAADVLRPFEDFVIYTPNTLALRGLQVTSQRAPVGIHGEGLDLLVASLPEADRDELGRRLAMIDWLDALSVDGDDRLKFAHHKMGRSQSRLYFRDRFMREGNDLLSAENANEGILHLLFHLAVFLSAETPRVFAVDNLEAALNPQLCRLLTETLAASRSSAGSRPSSPRTTPPCSTASISTTTASASSS